MTSMFDGPLRAQATLAAETLRQLNVPMVEALARQRELADSLAAAAARIAEVAETVERLARQHSEAAETMRAALEPYLAYTDWLAGLGSGEQPKSG
jgi:hypothetical protein